MMDTSMLLCDLNPFTFRDAMNLLIITEGMPYYCCLQA